MLGLFRKYIVMPKSFHTFIKVMIISVTVTGFRRGKMILKNKVKGPAPSITADSSISLGMLLKKPV
ncbi:hypothetical protein D3C74_449290 [compost metagenome]